MKDIFLSSARTPYWECTLSKQKWIKFKAQNLNEFPKKKFQNWKSEKKISVTLRLVYSSTLFIWDYCFARDGSAKYEEEKV